MAEKTRKFVKYTGPGRVSINRVGDFAAGDVCEVDAPVALGLVGSPGWEIFDRDPRIETRTRVKAPAAAKPEEEVKDGA